MSRKAKIDLYVYCSGRRGYQVFVKDGLFKRWELKATEDSYTEAVATASMFLQFPDYYILDEYGQSVQSE